MRRLMMLMPLLAAACSGGNPAKDAAQDAKDIAAVNAAQDAKPPAKPIAPQPILYFDVTKNKLYGSGCNFVASDGGMGAVLLAQNEKAFMKLDDNIVALAADKGSTALPQGGWSRYSGKEYALTLTKIDGGNTKKAGVIDMFDGQLVVTDPHDQIVYQAKGNVQCKPM